MKNYSFYIIPSQMLKGTLEGCILGVINQKETYDYKISQKLTEYGFGKIAEGTIYPLLLRLEKNSFISATYHKSEQGPKRKYYNITDSGEVEYINFIDSYVELTNAVNSLLEDI